MSSSTLVEALVKSRLASSRTKRKVFISYHHKNDQVWFDIFINTFSNTYDVFSDQSLNGKIRSDDPEYVNRVIREEYIVGSSITIVLCGNETWKRKYVDWEIYSTLHHKHALMGIALPTAIRNYQNNTTIVPDRLHYNVQSGYAHWLNIWPQNAQLLDSAIEQAINLSLSKKNIQNNEPKMPRNLP